MWTQFYKALGIQARKRCHWADMVEMKDENKATPPVLALLRGTSFYGSHCPCRSNCQATLSQIVGFYNGLTPPRVLMIQGGLNSTVNVTNPFMGATSFPRLGDMEKGRRQTEKSQRSLTGSDSVQF